MLRKRLGAIAICFISSGSFIFVLFLITNFISHRPNAFIRLIPPHYVLHKKVLDLQFNSWYIAGEFNGNIYLGNLTAPNRLLRLNYSLNDTFQIKILGPGNLQIHQGAFITCDSSFFYLMDGTKPTILRGDMLNYKLNYEFKPGFFALVVPLSTNSFVFRAIWNGENLLLKKTGSSSEMLAPNLLQKQVDGIFCTDGTLLKVPNSDKIVYVYFYRNQFICADTNLNLLYRGKTIDTVSHAHIKVGLITSENERTLSSPPMFVNKRACVSKDWLFINSALKADNDDAYDSEHASVIDVYALKDGKYHFSFYLPDLNGKKIRDFKVFGKTLVALYDHYISTYLINF